MLARAEERPHEELGVAPAPDIYGALPETAPGELPMVGHAHLDLAWLWTYADARRKALRTFSTALRQMTIDDRYVYAQSQPQLYAWVEADDPDLFARVRGRIGNGWGCERRGNVGRAGSARAVG